MRLGALFLLPLLCCAQIAQNCLPGAVTDVVLLDFVLPIAGAKAFAPGAAQHGPIALFSNSTSGFCRAIAFVLTTCTDDVAIADVRAAQLTSVAAKVSAPAAAASVRVLAPAALSEALLGTWAASGPNTQPDDTAVGVTAAVAVRDPLSAPAMLRLAREL